MQVESAGWLSTRTREVRNERSKGPRLTQWKIARLASAAHGACMRTETVGVGLRNNLQTFSRSLVTTRQGGGYATLPAHWFSKRDSDSTFIVQEASLIQCKRPKEFAYDPNRGVRSVAGKAWYRSGA